MESFNDNFTSKVSELNSNLSKFMEKNNNAAGTRARKNAQELKTMLQNLRIEILAKQKDNKEKKKVSGSTETEAVTEATNNDSGSESESD